MPRRGSLWLAIAMSVVSCLIWPRGLTWPRELFAPLLAPLSHATLYATDAVRLNVRDMLGKPMDEAVVRSLLEENPALRDQLSAYLDDELQRQADGMGLWLGELRRQLADLGRWRRAFADDFPCMLYPARVIGAVAEPYSRARLVRPEHRAGPGQFVTTRAVVTNRPTAVLGRRAVLASGALVGQVVASGAWTAHVQLVTDPDFTLRAEVVRVVYPDRPRTIRKTTAVEGKLIDVPLTADAETVPVSLLGRGDGMASEAVPVRHAIEPGDLVYTTGDELGMPSYVFVGTVTDLQPVANNPKHVRLSIAPGADLESLRDVYIVAPMLTEAR